MHQTASSAASAHEISKVVPKTYYLHTLDKNDDFSHEKLWKHKPDINVEISSSLTCRLLRRTILSFLLQLCYKNKISWNKGYLTSRYLIIISKLTKGIVTPADAFATILSNLYRSITKPFKECPDHVISTGHQMTNLVSNLKYLSLLCFLTVAESWNLGHLQGIIKRYFEWIGLLSHQILMLAEKIQTNIQKLTLNSSFDALSKWHDPHNKH